MDPLHTAWISTDYGIKSIKVFCDDISHFDENIDILTTSAFMNCYHPTPKTVFESLYDIGISVEQLAINPFMDLRKSCNAWLSQEIFPTNKFIHRIGCIELLGFYSGLLDSYQFEQAIINSIRAYFKMLDIAAIYGVKMETIALPLLGSGRQRIESSLIFIPLLNECISFLKRNCDSKQIYFIEINKEKAELIANYLKKSHTISLLSGVPAEGVGDKQKTRAFISYSSKDKNIADNLCFKLENNGIAVWYAPRDVRGPYAEAIANAIDNSTHFIVILSRNSMESQHVLNEIDLAFQSLPNNIRFKPLRIDNSLFTPSFKYYLSRQHWTDATIPPLEERLNDFVEEIV